MFIVHLCRQVFTCQKESHTVGLVLIALIYYSVIATCGFLLSLQLLETQTLFIAYLVRAL